MARRRLYFLSLTLFSMPFEARRIRLFNDSRNRLLILLDGRASTSHPLLGKVIGRAKPPFVRAIVKPAVARVTFLGILA